MCYTVQTVPNPRVDSAAPPRLETTHFQKFMPMQDVLCNVVGRNV